ncbi:MAG TPA: cell division protein SepF [Nitrososphaera sp.]
MKALTLRDLSDITAIKEDIKKHMILILRVTPLAQKDVEELRKVVEDLYSYAQSVGGDIARLGEERIVITPPGVKIWRGAYDLK